MAITSVGYDGIVNEAQWAEMIKKIGHADYGVVGVGDLKVTTVAGVDRTVSVAAGKGWGHGVFDTNSANITIQLDIVTTGFRWDLIALRRDWSPAGGTTTVVKVNGTSTQTIPAGRLKGPGTLDDQPLALVQMSAGQTSPTAIVDLRCWAGNGGLVAGHDLVMTYLQTIGAQIKMSQTSRLWNCVIDGAGNPLWTSTAPDGYIPMFGIGTSVAGGNPAMPGTSFLFQAGSSVGASDAGGYGRIVFPKPFPNGLLTIILTNGDSSIDRQFTHVITLTPAGVPYSPGSTSEVRYSVAVEDSAGTHRTFMVPNLNHRVNWFAIGW
jgi:hypothetical protein